MKNKRGRKPKNTLIVNSNPIFDNLNEVEVILKLNIINTDIEDNIENNYIDDNNYEMISSNKHKCKFCNSANNCNMGMPINYINDYYIIKDYFCNIECITKYILNSNIYNKYELYSLINMYHNDFNNTLDDIIKISSNLISEKMDVFYTNTNILEKRMQENVNIIKNPTSNLKLFRKKKQKDIILDIMSIN